MARIKVTTTVVWNVDSDAYLAAALEADAVTEMEAARLRADHGLLGCEATGYCDAQDHLPRWARDAMDVTFTHTSVERID